MAKRETLPLTRAAVEEYAATYNDCITEADRVLETGLAARVAAAREEGSLDRKLFLDLASWRNPRPRKWQESNFAQDIHAATAQAFRAGSAEEAIPALTALTGVGLRSAVGILHWMHPERFPALDARGVNALGLKVPKNWEDLTFYTKFVKRLLAIQRDLGVDLRTIDRALWAWDKSQGGK